MTKISVVEFEGGKYGVRLGGGFLCSDEGYVDKVSNMTWYSKEEVLQYCLFDTKEQAELRAEAYKKYKALSSLKIKKVWKV